MIKLKDILNLTERKVYTVNPDTKVIDAVNIMNDNNIGSVFVVEDDRLLGIFTEKNLIKICAEGHDLKTSLIKSVMTTKLVPSVCDENIHISMIKMTKNRIRYLPIMENGKFIAMVSIGDLVKKEIDSMQSEIETLQRYITQ